MARLGISAQLQWKDNAKGLARTAIDAIWPPHSLLDGNPLPRPELISGRDAHLLSLWHKIEFLDAPCCVCCGYPFEFDVGDDAVCGACASHSPAYTQGRSAIRYTESSKKIILDFKHGGHTDGLLFFAAQLHRVGRTILTKADALIPVPLHPKRLRQRRFNQSALLARKLSHLSHSPYLTRVLMRTRNTPSQGKQSYIGRKRNVSGAFRVRPSQIETIKQAHIVLIDDVFTTGATLQACAKVLLRAGARRVDFLTLMRVVRASNIAT